ncbi:hypothetical protein BKA62DRAFT_773727 [Auriculariales sp. MPI-PUGE-AT-0066]|nr:hypothetical protein BKA62DRAFT_773727 [Auriculariales sp. MPI-PUGE-AT-0066]
MTKRSTKSAKQTNAAGSAGKGSGGAKSVTSSASKTPASVVKDAARSALKKDTIAHKKATTATPKATPSRARAQLIKKTLAQKTPLRIVTETENDDETEAEREEQDVEPDDIDDAELENDALGIDGDDEDEEPVGYGQDEEDWEANWEAEEQVVTTHRARRPTPQIASRPARGGVDDSPVTVILDTPSRHANNRVEVIEFTPYIEPINLRDASKPLQGQHSPLSRAISQRSSRMHRADVVSRVGFFTPQSRLTAASQSVHDAARALGADRRLLRLNRDMSYHNNMTKMTLRNEATVRHEYIKSAQIHVPSAYKLGLAQGSPHSTKLLTAALLTRSTFTFAKFTATPIGSHTLQITDRNGPYRHPVFRTIMQEQLFLQHERMAVAELTRSKFNPMPIPTIALIATAVQCALHDWITGIYIPKKNPFTTDAWLSAYKKHVSALEKMKLKNRRLFMAWTRKMYTDCLETTEAYDAAASGDEHINDEEMEDYGDVDLEGIEDEQLDVDN